MFVCLFICLFVFLILFFLKWFLEIVYTSIHAHCSDTKYTPLSTKEVVQKWVPVCNNAKLKKNVPNFYFQKQILPCVSVFFFWYIWRHSGAWLCLFWLMWIEKTKTFTLVTNIASYYPYHSLLMFVTTRSPFNIMIPKIVWLNIS